MEGFEVTIDALRAAGSPVADELGALPLAETVAAVGEVLPGGAAAAAAAGVAEAWRVRVAATAEALARHTAALRAAADGYAAAERGAAAALVGER